MEHNLTLTLGDLSKIAGIVVIACGLLGVYIRLFVAAELVKQENRINEKVKLQFAEKEITTLKLQDIQKDVEELKKERQ